MKTAATIVDAPRTRVGDVLTLMKLRLNGLVVVTTAGGYYMAAPEHANVLQMLAACLGTLLVASGAAALNQVRERDLDRLMERTKSRPVADGRMSTGEASGIAYGLAAAGLLMLWLGANWLAASLALATLVFYLVVYTPMKRRSSFSTVVGAIPGALPPLIGWAAARGTIDVSAWSLFLIMFIWQLPHFLAISWIYREDYARAGFPMLAVVDTRGEMTGLQATLWAATLVPVSLLPALLHLSGAAYAIGALLLGVTLTIVAFGFAKSRTRQTARMLFLASITYLPILWLLMTLDRTA